MVDENGTYNPECYSGSGSGKITFYRARFGPAACRGAARTRDSSCHQRIQTMDN